MTKQRAYFYDYMFADKVGHNWYDCNILCRFTDCVHTIISK